MSNIQKVVQTKQKSGKRGNTRLRLMEAAERLFAEHGLHAVTLREINNAAGQRNESALHYHFGSKAGLIEAIFIHRVAIIDQTRQERVEALAGTDLENDLHAIIRATFEPLTELLATEEGVRFIRFSAQVLNDPDYDLPTIALRSGYEGIRRANMLIVSVLGDLPPEIAIQRQRLMIEMALSSMAIWTRRADPLASKAERLFFTANLFDAIVGAVSAPVSAEAMAALRKRNA